MAFLRFNDFGKRDNEKKSLLQTDFNPHTKDRDAYMITYVH